MGQIEIAQFCPLSYKNTYIWLIWYGIQKMSFTDGYNTERTHTVLIRDTSQTGMCIHARTHTYTHPWLETMAPDTYRYISGTET